MLYYKEGERLSELSNYVREWEDQLVEARTLLLLVAQQHAALTTLMSELLQHNSLLSGIGCSVTG